MNKKLIIPASIITVLLILGIALTLSKSNAQAQSIPDGSTFKQVKELSQGTKPQCLTNNSVAHAAVDKVKAPKNVMDSFDMIMGTRIIDMPAGYTTTTIHSFDGTTATGTNSYTDKNQKAFAGDLKSFNYQARLDATTHAWKLTSYVACY